MNRETRLFSLSLSSYFSLILDSLLIFSIPRRKKLKVGKRKKGEEKVGSGGVRRTQSFVFAREAREEEKSGKRKSREKKVEK